MQTTHEFFFFSCLRSFPLSNASRSFYGRLLHARCSFERRMDYVNSKSKHFGTIHPAREKFHRFYSIRFLSAFIKSRKIISAAREFFVFAQAKKSGLRFTM